jgi:predicted phosphodiesterase
VATAIVSDLHLGSESGADLARRPEQRERLIAALAGADHVVLLGDTLELRELPIAKGLEIARPLFEALGEATAGRRVTVVPGNHDHHIAEPWLTQLRVDGSRLGPVNDWLVPPGDSAAGELARLMPNTELHVAYPGLFLRPDVYATHGHYLDLHLTIPRPEGIASGLMGRITRTGRNARSATEYEDVLAPMYAFYARLAESAASRSLRKGSSLSRVVWRRLHGEEGGPIGRFLLGRVALPGSVAALNGLGLGPLGYDFSGEELRRSGLRSMARVVEGLGVQADHVLFGHTHRPGPLGADDPAEWRAGAARLWNTGSWLYEAAFAGPGGELGPYAPGTLIRLDDEGEPAIENVLATW